MTTRPSSENIRARRGPRYEEKQLVGARLPDEDVRLVDLARVYSGYSSRDAFIADAVMEKARDVLQGTPFLPKAG